MEHTQAYRDASRHVERKIGFFVHLAVYLLANTGLILSSLLHLADGISTSAPLFGWGIGLLFHGLAVFLRAPGAAWKERMIENTLNARKRAE